MIARQAIAPSVVTSASPASAFARATVAPIRAGETQVVLGLLASLAALGCRGWEGDVVTVSPIDGSAVDPVAAATGDAAASGAHAATASPDAATSRACASGADGIVVLDATGRLLRFQPTTAALTDPVPVACVPDPTCGSTFAAPAPAASLAVDRSGTVWVAACDGVIFRVDPSNGLCEPSGLSAEQAGFARLRMTFVADATAAGESLYVAGVRAADLAVGPTVPPDTSVLAHVRAPFQVQTVGPLAGWPVLAGTSDGQLWAGFPLSSGQTVPHLHSIDPLSGGDTGFTQQSALWSSDDLNPNPFAFWGGALWLFNNDGGRWVLPLPRTELGTVVPRPLDDGPRIVAAASSTCAPLQEP
jgi:hypothetical protein